MRTRDLLLAAIALGAAVALLVADAATPRAEGSRLAAAPADAPDPAPPARGTTTRAAAQPVSGPFAPRHFPDQLVAVSRERAIREAVRLVAGTPRSVTAEAGLLIFDLGQGPPTRWVWEVTLRGALPRGYLAGPQVPPLGIVDGTRVYVDAETGRPLLFGPDRVIVDATGLRRTLPIELELRVPALDSLAP